jgi:23S rRNA (pseudouridine1915-N3)-methyltransferase
MNIKIITVGKKTDINLADIIGDFEQRISRYIPIKWELIPLSDITKEGISILNKISDGDYVVALDNRGKEMSTEELADFTNIQMVSGNKNLVFIIGGSYGLDESVLKRADLVWSLSRLTFPHQIVRLILVESIYRAISVIKNEPYHH